MVEVTLSLKSGLELFWVGITLHNTGLGNPRLLTADLVLEWRLVSVASAPITRMASHGLPALCLVMMTAVSVSGHVHFSRMHLGRLAENELLEAVAADSVDEGVRATSASHMGFTPAPSTELCLECPRQAACVAHVQCPAHVHESNNIECHLPSGHIGLCCSTGHNHTGPSALKSREAMVRVSANTLSLAARSARREVDDMMDVETRLRHSAFHTVVDKGSASYGHYRNFRITDHNDLNRVMGLAHKALEVALATRAYKEREGISNHKFEMGLIHANLQHSPLSSACLPEPFCTRVHSVFRTVDGSCNNIINPKWGMTASPYTRLLPPYYEDAIWKPRVSRVDGRPLPSARVISANLFTDDDKPDPIYSLMLMQFGQFLSHDITRAIQSPFKDGSEISCCSADGKYELPPQARHPLCMPIMISRNDPFYKDFTWGCMNFVRSILAPRHDCSIGYTQQMNKVTHFLDASMVYGSDAATMASLRAFENGQMKVFKDFGRNLLPLTKHPDDCLTSEKGSACFVGGDPRSNQIISLSSLHLLFVREHNRIAHELSALNPHWSDDFIFLETRRIIGALMQHIFYNEWLPIVIGPAAMDAFRLWVQPDGYSSDYDPRVDPSIMNEFATAAYRLHTLVDGKFSMFEGKSMEEFTDISDVMFYPAKMRRRKFFDEMLNTLTSKPMQKFDASITEGLTRYMFRAGNPFGVDVAALNIQRGRDHGLRPYNDYRVLVGMPPITAWEEYSPKVADTLRKLYASTDDMDLFVGGLLETPSPGAVVGKTFRDIIADQFSRLRRGDRYFYEHNPDINPGHFTLDQLREIKKVTMSRLVCDNSDHILLEKQAPNAFLIPSPENQYVDCRSPVIPHMNLIYWKDI